MRLVQDSLLVHFQYPLTRLLMVFGNCERQCIIQHSRGDVCHGAEFPMEYVNKLIRGDPQGGHSIGQLCGEGRQSWDKHTS